MALFKLVWNFSQGGNNPDQWSEVWYISAADLQSAVNSETLARNGRLNLLWTGNTLVKARLSQVGAPRVATIVNIKLKGLDAISNVPATNGVAAVANIASVIVPARRKVWIRGMSRDAVNKTTAVDDVFDPAFLSNFNNCMLSFSNQRFCIAVRQPSSNPGNQYVNILRAGPASQPGFSTLVLQGATNYQVGQQVAIGRCSKKDLPALNGIFSVVGAGTIAAPDPLAGNGYVVVPYTTPEGQTLDAAPGRLRLYTVIDTAVISPGACGLAYIGVRKTKAPFVGSRGAKSAARGLRQSP